jgi:predicted DNA-binding protein
MTITTKGAPIKSNPRNCRINVHITEERDTQLGAIAKKLYRAKASLVAELIEKYLAKLDDT